MHKERDDYFMRLAFRQALRGRGRTSPNPLVGTVIVKNDRIIATGYHGFFGGPHSEVVALANKLINTGFAKYLLSWKNSPLHGSD